MRRRPSCQRRASRDFVASPKRYAETGIREALLPAASQIGRSRRQCRRSSARLTSSRLIAGLREPNGQTVPTPQALLIACASCIHKLSTASLPVPLLRMPSPRRHCAYALRHCFIKLLARPKTGFASRFVEPVHTPRQGGERTGRRLMQPEYSVASRNSIRRR